MAHGSISLDPVPNVDQNVAFNITGTLHVTPVVTYKDDGGAAHAVTMTALAAPISIAHPGLAAGAHSVVVADSVSGASATATVTSVAPASAVFIGAGESFTAKNGDVYRLDTGDNLLRTPSGGTEVGTGYSGGVGDIGWNAEAAAYYQDTVYVQDIRTNAWRTFDPASTTFSGSTVTAPPGAGSSPPPAAVFITPGSGTLTDSAGNHYHIDSGENAFKTPAAGGADIALGTIDPMAWNTEAMALYNGSVYLEDIRDHSWHTFNGTAFSAAVDAPPGAPSNPSNPPPPPSGVPAEAAAVGYTKLTYGPDVTLGTNWFGSAGNALTQNADGSVTDAGGVPNHYNGHAVTHQEFGGGFYVEGVISFLNAPAGWSDTVDGWPAFWSIANPTTAADHVECDFFEFETAGVKNEFEFGMPDWHADGSITWSGDGGYGVNTNCNLPADFDPSQKHTYAFLWVPATDTDQGYTKVFVDGVHYGPIYTWTKGTGPWNTIDNFPQQLIFGTGSANPMTVYSVSVWQKDPNSNGTGGGTPGGGGGGGTGATNTFSTTFGGSFPSSQWVKSQRFDDGGNGFFEDDPAVQAQTSTMSSDHLNLNLVAIGSNRYNAPDGKTAFAGVIDNYNGGHAFTQEYGYFEIDCSVDKVVGLGLFCFTLSVVNWPPNFGMPCIWTDDSGTMQLQMFASGDDSSIYAISEGTNGWTGTARHKYGLNATPDVIEFYLDRVLVKSVPNPGGAYTNGDGWYTKVHVQTDFYPDLVNVDTGNLPAGGRVYSFNVWDAKPFT